MTPGRFVLKSVGTFAGVAGLVACLTVLYRCMRSVMTIGGACASGGPYEIARPCPDGIGWMTPVSILLGLVMVGVVLFFNHGMPGPKAVAFAWPALFLSLGWNFWEFGLDPPGDARRDAGWIVCGVIFVLMGAVPLLVLLGRRGRRDTLWSDGSPEPAPRPSPSMVLRAARPTFPSRMARRRDVADDLARLAALHRDGLLSDDEFAAAKARLLGAAAP